MIPDLIKCAMIFLFTQAVFVTGAFFISGRMLPSLMSGFYARTNPLVRTVISAVLILPLGNFILAYAYTHLGTVWVSPMSLTALVLVSASFTMLLLGVRLSLWIVPATLAVVAGSIWVNILLEGKQP